MYVYVVFKRRSDDKTKSPVHGDFVRVESGALAWASVRSKSSGLAWEQFGEDPLTGYVYGKFTPGNVTGYNIAFVYPDMRTALVGQFKDKKMVSARASRITKTRYAKIIMSCTWQTTSLFQVQKWLP